METGEDPILVNELLFFIQNKIHSTTKDSIVETCAKFYSLDEITKAISVFESALKIRLSKRKNADDLANKLLNDLYDKIWSLDAAATQIPRFAAMDLSRVPRESENSETVASPEQILCAIHSLKTIVANLQKNMITRDILEKILQDSRSSFLTEMSTTTAGVPFGEVAPSKEAALPSAPPMEAVLPSAPSVGVTLPSAPSAGMTLPSAPPLPLTPTAPSLSQSTSSVPPSVAPSTVGTESGCSTSVNDGAAISTRVELSNRQYVDAIQRQNAKIPRSSRSESKSAKVPKRGGNTTLIIGKKVSSGVLSFKGADLTVARYVGRVAMGTSVDDIRSALESNNVDVVGLEEITWAKHKRFKSFKLIVKKAQLEIIEDPNLWPEGVVVGRWWSPKTPRTGETTSDQPDHHGSS